jgi:hypothetical protein
MNNISITAGAASYFYERLTAFIEKTNQEKELFNS